MLKTLLKTCGALLVIISFFNLITSKGILPIWADGLLLFAGIAMFIKGGGTVTGKETQSPLK